MTRAAAWFRYVLRRAGLAVLSLWGVLTITFVAIHVVADPINFIAGQFRTAATVAALRHELGLDQPLWQQYLVYLQGIFHFDLGRSLVSGRPVLSEILSRLPATLELVVLGMTLTVLITVVMAVLGARHPHGLADRAGDVLITVGASFPPFWIGLLLVFVFYFALGWAPAPLGQLDLPVAPPPTVTGSVLVDAALGGDSTAFGSALGHLVLPLVTIVIMLAPTILQTTRASMREVLRSDYIRTARACGLPGRMIEYRYALKNVLVPLINIVALTTGFAISGAVLIEVVFSWPGIGLYAVQSMEAADYSPVLGVVLVSATAYVVLYNLADVVAAIIDPRITLS